MTRFHRSALILVATLPVLAACGEGWVMQPVRNYVPYTEERTAGPGVAYVRAYMLPEKGPVLEPVMTPVVVPAAEPMEDAAPIFTKKQQKVQK